MSALRVIHHRRTAWAALVALSVTLPLLGGCGKKPSHLDPPEGSGPAAALYPRLYPNLKYDPPPPSGAGAPGAPLGTATPSKASPPSETPLPHPAYPEMITPGQLAPASTLAMPGQGSGGPSAWPGEARTP